MRMKVFGMIAIISLCLVCLAGCGNTGSSNTLTVCTLGQLESYSLGDGSSLNINQLVKAMEKAINASDSKVKIEVVEIPVSDAQNGVEEQEAFVKRMQVEIMSGKGPDLFLLPTLNFMDEKNLIENPEKSMANGLFADLTALTEKDPEWDKLIQPVMDAGKLEDKQYLIPLQYTYPMLVVLQEEFQKMGLEVSELTKSTQGFLAGFTPDQPVSWRRSATDLLMENLYGCLDIAAVDYRAQKLHIQESDILAVLEQYREIARGIQFQPFEEYKDNKGIFTHGQSVLTEKQSSIFCDAPYETLPVIAELKYSNTPYETIPLVNAQGRITPYATYYGAVSASCKNIPAAYEFIRLFLSPAVQSGTGGEAVFGGQTLPVAAAGFNLYQGWSVRGDIDTALLWESYINKATLTSEAEQLGPVLTDEDIAPAVELLDRGRIRCQLDQEFRNALLQSYYKEEDINVPELTAQFYKLLKAAAVE